MSTAQMSLPNCIMTSHSASPIRPAEPAIFRENAQERAIWSSIGRMTPLEAKAELLFLGTSHTEVATSHPVPMLVVEQAPDMAQSMISSHQEVATMRRPSDRELDKDLPWISADALDLSLQIQSGRDVRYQINDRGQIVASTYADGRMPPTKDDLVTLVEGTLGYRPDDHGTWHLARGKEGEVLPAWQARTGLLHILAGRSRLNLLDLRDPQRPMARLDFLLESAYRNNLDGVNFQRLLHPDGHGHLVNSVAIFPAGMRKLARSRSRRHLFQTPAFRGRAAH
jgi:hypothetical protein